MYSAQAYQYQLESDYINAEERLPSGISFYPRKTRAIEHAGLPKRSHVALTAFPQWPRPGNSTSKSDVLHCLPLLNVDVDVNVLSTVSRTTLKQTFLNFGDDVIEEAKYSFPLYDGAIVFSFRCIIGQDRVLQGVVKPKDEARSEFKKALSEERVAALLEEHTTEIFEIQLGNIPADTTVQVEIAYALELKADIGGEGVLVTIPTSIAPRYGAPPSDYQPNSFIDTSETGLYVKVDVFAPTAIRKIESRTHPISVEMGLDEPTQVSEFNDIATVVDDDPFQKARATLSDKTTYLGRDFVILVLCTGSELLKSQALIEAGSTHDQSAMMVTFSPRSLFGSHVSGNQDFEGEIIFVIDCSGSMDGTKLQTAKEALKISLKSLPAQCSFNVFAFGSTYSSLRKTSTKYSQDTLDDALTYVSDLHKMGGTELLSAVRAAVESRTSLNECNAQIILLTDGEIWEVEQAIEFTKSTHKESSHRTRFFALGIGDSVSHRLIEGIGQVGGGFGEVVEATHRRNWRKQVLSLLKGALLPNVWHCTLELNGIQSAPQLVNDNSGQEWIVQAPTQVPPIHWFSRQSVFFLLHEEAAEALQTITVKTVTPSGDKISAPISPQRAKLPRDVLHYLSAKAIIKDLESGQASAHPSKDHGINNQGSNTLLQIQAERLGASYNIASKWTSFVASDREPRSSTAVQIYKAQGQEVASLMKPMKFPSGPVAQKHKRLLGNSQVQATSLAKTKATPRFHQKDHHETAPAGSALSPYVSRNMSESEAIGALVLDAVRAEKCREPLKHSHKEQSDSQSLADVSNCQDSAVGSSGPAKAPLRTLLRRSSILTSLATPFKSGRFTRTSRAQDPHSKLMEESSTHASTDGLADARSSDHANRELGNMETKHHLLSQDDHYGSSDGEAGGPTQGDRSMAIPQSVAFPPSVARRDSRRFDVWSSRYANTESTMESYWCLNGASSLMDIVDAQWATGSFSNNPEYLQYLLNEFQPETKRCIASLLRKTSRTSAIADNISNDLVGKITSTILSVALLKAKFEDDKDLWEMMVEKAERWLAQHIPDTELLGKLWQLAERSLAEQSSGKHSHD